MFSVRQLSSLLTPVDVCSVRQLSSLLLGIHDPFVPFENLFCAVFLGGVWDSLQRAVSGGRAAAADPARADAKPEPAKKKD